MSVIVFNMFMGSVLKERNKNGRKPYMASSSAEIQTRLTSDRKWSFSCMLLFYVSLIETSNPGTETDTLHSPFIQEKAATH
jgi:hypothetical protein